MRPAEAVPSQPGKYWQRYGIHESCVDLFEGHIVHGLLHVREAGS